MPGAAAVSAAAAAGPGRTRAGRRARRRDPRHRARRPRRPRSSCSYLAISPGPSGGRAVETAPPTGGREQRAVGLRDRARPLAPAGRRPTASAAPRYSASSIRSISSALPGRSRRAHRRDPEALGQRAHAQRRRGPARRPGDRRRHDGVDVELRPRPAPARPCAATAGRACGRDRRRWSGTRHNSVQCTECRSPRPPSPSTSTTRRPRPRSRRPPRLPRDMAADGFVSLSRPDAGFNLVYLRTGLPSFKPPALAGHRADGLLVAFVVDDVDAEHDRLVAEGWRSRRRSRRSRGASATSRSPTLRGRAAARAVGRGAPRRLCQRRGGSAQNVRTRPGRPWPAASSRRSARRCRLVGCSARGA